ncbi:MAG: SH3 domain-containing protein, partial [Firmicutes bacterium]|nr:SH3 domain-containing protein [Bacillota bacterium]
SPTGIYYYVSGVEDTACLYADSSIISEVLAELENGDSVEFLEEVNGRFTFVYHEESDQYGYIRSSELVANLADVDYGNIENIYANEKSLGYWYVTNTQNGLNLWENPDGGGVVKAKLENGFKVSVLEKTNNSYWYVFDYNSAERGYVRTAYLTDDESKVVGIDKEPEDKTVIGDYFVTGVKNYLPIYSDTSTSSTVRGKLYNGDKVGLIEKTNSTFWYISANGVYGWVSASYLTATDPNPPEPEPTPPPDTSNDYKVYNTQEYLPVLKDPQVGGEELGRIYNGDTVTFIKEYDDKFWYVKVPSLGIEGYVAKEYLTK